MAVFVATAGTAFESSHFGSYDNVGDVSFSKWIDGSVNWATAALNSFRLFQTVWLDQNFNGINEPHNGDLLLGRVDYDVILPATTLPLDVIEITTPYSGITTAHFVDLISNKNVGTITGAPYDVSIVASLQEGFTTYSVNFFDPILTLFSGDDTVTLADLADNFYDPSGALLITMGGGNDTLFADGAGADTAHGGAGDDVMTLNAGGQLFGDDGNDTLFAGGVNNDATPTTLEGGAGDDDMYGYFGNDTFVEGAGSGDDLLDGGEGTDLIDYSGAGSAVVVDMAAFISTRLPPEFYSGTAIGGSGEDYFLNIENVGGSAFADDLRGDFRNNLLMGNAGDDLLQGGFGADTLDGGTGRDAVSYAGARGGVTVSLTTGAGNRGEALGDVLLGIEDVTGGNGSDKFIGDASDNVLDGGSAGADVLTGMAGNDLLRGQVGGDRLSGGDGDDRLNGGLGADILLGGLGNDRFVFASILDSRSAGADQIMDFGRTPGDRDRIDLHAIDAVPVTEFANEAFVLTARRGAGDFTLNAGELQLVHVRAGIEVRMDVDGDGISDMEILVRGALTLTAHDFLL